MISSVLIPAVVRKQTVFLCLGTLRGGQWGGGESLRLMHHACVPEPDLCLSITNPDCSL